MYSLSRSSPALWLPETQPKSPEKQAPNAGIRSQIPGPQLSRDKVGYEEADSARNNTEKWFQALTPLPPSSGRGVGGQSEASKGTRSTPTAAETGKEAWFTALPTYPLGW